MNNHLFQSFSAPASPVMTMNRKSSDKCLRVSGKRKLLLSPSKDLLVFFGNQAFNKLNTAKIDQNQKKYPKLTLDKKKINNQESSSSKKNTSLQKMQRKVLSKTDSTQSCQSNENQANQSQQKFLKLKKQVDQIRRKYSYNKIGERSSFQSIDHSEKIKISTQNSSYVSKQSFKMSKEKQPFLTPKNDRYLGKRILTKNVFAQQQKSKLRFTNNIFTKTLKINTKQSQEMRRKGSYQFSNFTSSMNMSQQMIQTDQKSIFQFTFGSMAMMDFQNKQNIKGNKLKI